MKNFYLFTSILMLFFVPAFATDQPEPFGLVLNKMSYEDVLNQWVLLD